MRKTRTDSGITLVALIITIVVLLILAAISINAIQNDGIMGMAQGSADKFNQAQRNEQGILGGYEDEMNKYGGGSGEQLTEEDLAEIALMERYVLGAEKTGKLLTDILNLDTMEFIDDPESITDASRSVSFLSIGQDATETKGMVYVQYNYKRYKILVNVTTLVTEAVEIAYKKELTEEDLAEIEFMERYVLGAEKTGRALTELFNFDTGVFLDDTETTEVDESKAVIILDTGANDAETKRISIC